MNDIIFVENRLENETKPHKVVKPKYTRKKKSIYLK